MRVLAIDTSSNVATVAVMEDEENSQLYVAGLFASCTLLAGHIALI